MKKTDKKSKYFLKKSNNFFYWENSQYKLFENFKNEVLTEKSSQIQKEKN